MPTKLDRRRARSRAAHRERALQNRVFDIFLGDPSGWGPERWPDEVRIWRGERYVYHWAFPQRPPSLLGPLGRPRVQSGWVRVVSGGGGVVCLRGAGAP